MSCNHEPHIKIKLLFARKPVYICRHCGETIELIAKLRNINRILGAVFVAVLLFKALSTGKGEPSVRRIIIDLSIMVGMILFYLVVEYLLLRFGKYETVEPDEPAPGPAGVADEAAGRQASASQADQATVQAPAATLGQSAAARDGSGPDAAPTQYTQEQLDLMAMYAAYERQAQTNAESARPGQAGQSGKSAPAGQHSSAAANQPGPQVETCAHVPVKSWKNYIPSRYDFVCARCSQPITFNTRTKRSMNMAYLAIMALILLPTFNNQAINFWQYGLLTLAAFAIATVMQLFFLKKSTYVLKSTDARK